MCKVYSDTWIAYYNNKYNQNKIKFSRIIPTFLEKNIHNVEQNHPFFRMTRHRKLLSFEDYTDYLYDEYDEYDKKKFHSLPFMKHNEDQIVQVRSSLSFKNRFQRTPFNPIRRMFHALKRSPKSNKNDSFSLLFDDIFSTGKNIKGGYVDYTNVDFRNFHRRFISPYERKIALDSFLIKQFLINKKKGGKNRWIEKLLH